MNKKNFQNCMSKQKRTFESYIKEYESLTVSESVKNKLQKISVIDASDAIPSTSAGRLGVEFESGEFISSGSETESVLSTSAGCLGSEIGSGEFSAEPEEASSLATGNIDRKTKCEELKSWAVRNKISQNALEDLLHTLKRMGVEDLPLSAKTVLNTSRENIDISTIPEGEFLYLGIQKYFLSESFDFLRGKEEIAIDVGIDGLKLFKSSNRVLWPIVGAVVGFADNSPFLIACFSGFKKPKDLNSFMANFCAEVKVLQESGIRVGFNQKLLRFKVRLFVCDAPARAFVTGVVSHNGKNGCPKCCQVGLYRERRVCFSKEVGVLRTDLTFSSRLSPSHHIEEFKVNRSVLEETGFGMVSQFPLDCMHLVYLGLLRSCLSS